MMTSSIFNNHSISNAANEAIRENRLAALTQRIAQVRADQNSFTGSCPSGSGSGSDTRPAPDTTGTIAFHGSSPEVAGSMGVRKPEPSFGSGVETAGTIAFHGSSPEVAGSMGMVTNNVSFEGGAGITEIKKTNAGILISKGKDNIAQGKALLNAAAKAQNSGNSVKATSLEIQGKAKINQGKTQVAQGQAQLDNI